MQFGGSFVSYLADYEPLSLGLLGELSPGKKSGRRKSFRRLDAGPDSKRIRLIHYLILAAAFFSDVLQGAEWEAGPGYRSIQLAVPHSGRPGFSLLSSERTGIRFSNNIPENVYTTNQLLLDGSGIAAGDVDGDGRCDLYFCAIDGRNRLYHNLGEWHFEDITDTAGVGCDGLRSTGATFVDLNGDGSLDLIVNTTGNGTHIFLNDGHGHFRPMPKVVNGGRGAKSLAIADVDGDGYPDVYVVNYRASSVMDIPNARATFKRVNGQLRVETFNGRPVTDPDLVDRFTVGPKGDFQENGEPDVLYRNLGGSNLVPIPFTGGNFLDESGRPLAGAPLEWGLSAMFRDINGDGLPDLYVCNDFQSPDRFWINQGGGKFRLLPREAQRKSSMSSMAVDFADINRDGCDDFFVADMMSRAHSERMCFLSVLSGQSVPGGPAVDRPQYELNTLFLNRGDCSFAEIAQLSGVEAAEWAWSCIFLDVDLDGWEDLLVANGMERTGRDLDALDYIRKLRAGPQPSDAELFRARRMYPRQANGNLAFRNLGDLTFAETSKAWGFDFKGVSSAMALADLDNDGALDVVVNPLNSAALIYRNNSGAPRIAVRLKGLPPNTSGIGARIGVTGGAVPLQTQEMICGGRYLSGDEMVRSFAAGSPTNRLTIEVSWRSGRHSVVTNAMPNRLYEIEEAGSQTVPAGVPRLSCEPAARRRHAAEGTTSPMFEDVSDKLAHVHQDDPFGDFVRQPLLPNKLSQLGPGLAWFDLDNDGYEDLLIGGGAGGRLGIFRNDSHGGFTSVSEAAFSAPLARDLTTLLGWHSPNRGAVVLAGMANYEDGQSEGPAVMGYDFARKTTEDILTTDPSSTGPMALGSPGQDGGLELFVGGRVIAGHWPEAASSRLLRFDGHKWQLDAENSRRLEKVGLVSGAVFSDLDGDGYAELILACEWGPIRVFHNNQGELTAWDVPLVWSEANSNAPRASTLSQLTGWWNSVTAGDFDSDGRLDLVAGNWGRNTKYQPLRSQPLSLYYGDFAGDGSVQIVEAHYEPPLQKTVPLRQRDALARGIPAVRARFATHRAYSTASVEEVLGEQFKHSKLLRANCLESLLLLNRGDHFEVRVLPVEAQMSPVFGICVGDFEGDGNEDLFLAQNFFEAQPETPRYDAGRGLLLQGDGQGHFQAVPGQESGIRIYGEQRGAALCDFDHDGRVDLVVAQNSAQTRLFRNAGGKAGLRVRLKGGPNNPDAFGAVIRLKSGTRWGPAREIHGGAGYWSQDSSVEVLGAAGPVAEIQVLWPGGKHTTNSIPAGAKEIQLGMDGTLKLLR